MDGQLCHLDITTRSWCLPITCEWKLIKPHVSDLISHVANYAGHILCADSRDVKFSACFRYELEFGWRNDCKAHIAGLVMLKTSI